MRIRATNNVAKLTSVMRLVAQSKLKAVEETLNRGRAFGESILNAIALPDHISDAVKKKAADEEKVRGRAGWGVVGVAQSRRHHLTHPPSPPLSCAGVGPAGGPRG